MNQLWFTLLLMFFAAPLAAAANPRVIHHDMELHLFPAEGRLEVVDRITLPQPVPDSGLLFRLHSGFDPIVEASVKAKILPVRVIDGTDLKAYQIQLPADKRQFTLRYSGVIRHAFDRVQESPGRQHQRTRGTISAQGIFLDGASGWYPRFDKSLQTFALTAAVPQDWLLLSQGAGPGNKPKVHWREDQPQDDIYLIAAPFTLYREPTDHGEAQVYLRQPDPTLAGRYIAATKKYLDLYSRLLGPYPYAKFALVENFWETGYGMPSFTLLGSRVIRLPFIINSSYPHEILHNWWGNGVYVDYDSGNWSEGLTTYLADHLLQEQKGQGADYRRNALQRYESFVRSDNDFPLAAFRGRHGTASQSVGYDKTLMLFHMLRQRLGDNHFLAALRYFFQENQFRIAGFAELQHAFEHVSGAQLDTFFRQWTRRTGAPQLRLETPTVELTNEGYLLQTRLRQTQDGPSYVLDIPVIVHLESQAPLTTLVHQDAGSTELRLLTKQRPVRLEVDPYFDLFRRLDPLEMPPSFGRLFGAEKGLFVLPSAASGALKTAYLDLATRWAEGQGGAKIVWDDQMDHLPARTPLWVLGWENRFRPEVWSQLPDESIQHNATQFIINGQPFSNIDNSLALVAGTARDSERPKAWIGSGNPAAIAALARKLPHYSKYGFLVFAGSQATNQIKGQWPIAESPLKVWLSEKRSDIQLPPRPPLTAVLQVAPLP